MGEPVPCNPVGEVQGACLMAPGYSAEPMPSGRGPAGEYPSRGLVVSLCDRTGNMVQPWLAAGYSAATFDLQDCPELQARRAHFVRDVLDLVPEAFADPRPVAVFAFPPCTDLAGSGARWYRDKGLGRLIHALRVVEACRTICEASGAPWMLENPVGVLTKFWRQPDHAFHPVHYRGYAPEPERDDYTKKTHLWTGGGFIMPDRRPGEPTLGSMMWRLPPSVDRADLRSATPLGFAHAVFEANRPDRMARTALGTEARRAETLGSAEGNGPARRATPASSLPDSLPEATHA